MCMTYLLAVLPPVSKWYWLRRSSLLRLAHALKAIHACVGAENAIKCHPVLAQNHMPSHQHLSQTGQYVQPYGDLSVQVRESYWALVSESPCLLS